LLTLAFGPHGEDRTLKAGFRGTPAIAS